MNRVLFILLRISGLPFLFREFIQRKKVTILLFHDISKDAAEKNFRYLSRKYNIIDLNKFIDAIENQDDSKIPRKALIITFDDGHIGNYKILSIIKKLKLPVTIFVCTSIIGTNRHFWFKFNNHSIPKEKLKRVPNIERLKILSKFGYEQENEFEKPQALQREHIDEMKLYVNLQSHTMYHPILPYCNYKEARDEIFGSKKMLESGYDIKINAISYPTGDYSERDILLTKEAGYKCGLTVDFGFNNIKTDIFRLKRISVNDTEDINELIVKASGVWVFLKTKIFGIQKSGLTNGIN